MIRAGGQKAYGLSREEGTLPTDMANDVIEFINGVVALAADGSTGSTSFTITVDAEGA